VIKSDRFVIKSASIKYITDILAKVRSIFEGDITIKVTFF